MKITKIGHCCLYIELDNFKILTDPGAWTVLPEQIPAVDLVLITHEHSDHLHMDSLKKILEANPTAKVVTNTSVEKIIGEEGLSAELLMHGDKREYSGISISGHGEKHAPIYPTIDDVENTGFLIANRFFYPGDALYRPEVEVEILALPVCGPWLAIDEALDYAKAVKPQHAFPVHDGMLRHFGPFHKLPELMLTPVGINFKPLLEGESLVY